MPERIKIVAVMGPTASGKSRLAVELAKRHRGEIVSADSMQIYKGMQIGTAKPTPAQMQGVAHHLIDFVEPTEVFSVAAYAALAQKCIREIAARGNLPLLVGGTGLYIRAVLENLTFAGGAPDERLRQALRQKAEQLGGAALLDELRAFDPETADKLHPNDTKRIIRALELYYTSGMTMSEQRRRSRQEPPEIEAVKIAIGYSDREKLYRRIHDRVAEMMRQGLLAEAQAFSGLGKTAVQAIGYKELTPYFAGEISQEEAVEAIRRETRRYAKRQMTWLRREPDLNWILADQFETFDEMVLYAEKIIRPVLAR